MRGREPELELSNGEGEGEGGEKRECFKCCGAQNNQLGSDRSDRSPIPVRPVRAELAQADRNNLGALSRGLKLMTVINLIN